MGNSIVTGGLARKNSVGVGGYAAPRLKILEKPHGRKSRHASLQALHWFCTFNVEESRMQAWPSVFEVDTPNMQIFDTILKHTKSEKSKTCSICVIDTKNERVYAIEARVTSVAKDKQTVTFNVESQRTYEIGYEIDDSTDLILELLGDGPL